MVLDLYLGFKMLMCVCMSPLVGSFVFWLKSTVLTQPGCSLSEEHLVAQYIQRDATYTERNPAQYEYENEVHHLNT